MPYSALSTIGNQQIALYGLPDLVARHQPGLLLDVVDNYWGGARMQYVRAAGTIRQGGLVVLTHTFVSGAWRADASEVPNTANLGRSLYVAMTSATAGQFFWVVFAGLAVINCQAAIAADTTLGIAAAGQGGANTAGKQILNARVVGASTITSAKTNCFGLNGALQITVPNSDGWFIGGFLSGTGVGAAAVVTDISPDGKTVTVSVANTAQITGTVTLTYNNGVIFYHVVHINAPFAQGAIT